MRKRMNSMTWVGALAIMVSLPNLVEPFFTREDIWWTPMDMLLSLEQSKDKVAVYIAGQPLQEHVQQGSLLVRGEQEKFKPVAVSDIGFRVNNWEARRASLYAGATISASVCTAGLAMLLVGLLLMPRLDKSEGQEPQ